MRTIPSTRARLLALVLAPILAPILAVGTLSPAALADVLVVDPAGTGDHTTLAAAVQAAVDGDVILVKAGTYTQSVDVDDKALVIQAEAGAQPRVRNTFTVHDLAAGKTFVLRGIEVSPTGTGLEGLIVDNNAGLVRIEDCELKTRRILGNAITVRFNDAVSFARCTITGPFGPDSCSGCTGGIDTFPIPGGGGGFLRQSQVAFHDCDLTGGRGGSDNDLVGTAGDPGGLGMEIVDGEVFISGGNIVGGAGGTGGCEPPISSDDTCYDGGDGGHGLEVRGGARVDLLGTVPQGGQGGPPGGVPGVAGMMGLGTFVDGASVTSLQGIARGFDATSPVREGESVVLTYRGNPGDAVAVWGSLSAGYFPLPEYAGVFQLGLPLLQPFGIPIGFADATGALQLSVPVTELGAGIEGFSAHLQATAVESGGSTLALTPTTTVVFLDASL